MLSNYKKSIYWISAVCLLLSTFNVKAEEVSPVNKDLIPVIVLDIEMRGDMTVESMKATDADLQAEFSNELRRLLKDNQLFNVIDDSGSRDIIKQAAKNNLLHRCNGCELDLAKKLGAKQVIVPWLYRMSKLIQTMYIEIRDVETGTILRVGRNFRGNTVDGWQHVINHLVDAIKESQNDDETRDQ